MIHEKHWYSGYIVHYHCKGHRNISISFVLFGKTFLDFYSCYIMEFRPTGVHVLCIKNPFYLVMYFDILKKGVMRSILKEHK